MKLIKKTWKSSYNGLRKTYYKRFIFPIFKSNKVAAEIPLGIAIGVFWGMTSTVSAQMYIVFMQWLIHNYIIRKKFDLTLALAMVWISNPLTILPMYYVFYQTGEVILSLLNGFLPHPNGFVHFMKEINAVYASEGLSFLKKTENFLKLLFSNFGLYLAVGSLVYAIPSALGSYFLVDRTLLPLIERRRQKK